MIKKMKLNWNINGSSINGHLYDKEEILESLKKVLNNGELFVLYDEKSNVMRGLFSKEIYGVVEGFDEKNGIVTFDVKIIKDELPFNIVTSSGFGNIDEDKIVKNFSISHLFLTGDVE